MRMSILWLRIIQLDRQFGHQIATTTTSFAIEVNKVIKMTNALVMKPFEIKNQMYEWVTLWDNYSEMDGLTQNEI